MVVDKPMNTAAEAAWPTAEEQEILRSTFVRLIPACEALAFRLYDRLFEEHPELRDMFPPDLFDQQEKLVKMLAAAVDALKDPEEFRRECLEAGRRHVKYGAKAEHYPIVGRILVEELGRAIDPPLTRAEIELWERQYTLVAQEMLKAEG